MTFNQRKELLEEAYQLIADAVGNITMAVRDTDLEDHAHSYIIPHLENWLGGEDCNPYDMGIMDYVQALDKHYNGQEA
jgi:hypothetical protein